MMSICWIYERFCSSDNSTLLGTTMTDTPSESSEPEDEPAPPCSCLGDECAEDDVDDDEDEDDCASKSLSALSTLPPGVADSTGLTGGAAAAGSI